MISSRGGQAVPKGAKLRVGVMSRFVSTRFEAIAVILGG
jgi:hypothetical protein